jgi:hypothetical protein
MEIQPGLLPALIVLVSIAAVTAIALAILQKRKK